MPNHAAEGQGEAGVACPQCGGGACAGRPGAGGRGLPARRFGVEMLKRQAACFRDADVPMPDLLLRESPRCGARANRLFAKAQDDRNVLSDFGKAFVAFNGSIMRKAGYRDVDMPA